MIRRNGGGASKRTKKIGCFRRYESQFAQARKKREKKIRKFEATASCAEARQGEGSRGIGKCWQGNDAEENAADVEENAEDGEETDQSGDESGQSGDESSDDSLAGFISEYSGDEEDEDFLGE